MDNQNLNCCGIYKITNTVNNKFYIGSSVNIKERIRKHFEMLKRNSHHSTHLQNAYNKYGKNVFNVSILEICDKSELLIIEQKYLDEIINWQNVYNMTKNAEGGNGLFKSINQKEIKQKISNSCKGIHTKPFYIDNIRYETLKDAAEIFNVTISTISNKIKDWRFKNYYYENRPKIGKFDPEIHDCYNNVILIPKEKKKYYCDCGAEINKYAEFCDNCRKERKNNRIYINPVIINDVEYYSAKYAAKILKIEYATLIYRINTNTLEFKNYYYKSNPKDITKLTSQEDKNKKNSIKMMGNKSAVTKMPFMINNIRYETLREASIALNLDRKLIWSRLKNNNFNEYQYI